MPPKTPKPTDRIVGRNIRMYRLAKKMSQRAFAQELGLTFQQIQKYESGTNRVGGSRLLQMADILGIPVTTLFAGTQVRKSTKPNPLPELIASPNAIRLLEAFSVLSSSSQQTLLKLAEDLAKNTER